MLRLSMWTGCIRFFKMVRWSVALCSISVVHSRDRRLVASKAEATIGRVSHSSLLVIQCLVSR